MVGKKLKQIRQSQKLSKLELARRSKISARAIENIEYGKASPTLRTLEHLAKALNVEVVDFIN